MGMGHVCTIAQTTTMPSGSARHIIRVFMFMRRCGRLTNIITATLTIAIPPPPSPTQAAAMVMTMSMCIAMAMSITVAAAMTVIAIEVALAKVVFCSNGDRDRSWERN